MERHTAHVADWMSRSPITVGPDTSVIEAYERMRSKGVRRLPVVQADGSLVGIITRSDIEQAMPFSRDEAAHRQARFALAGMTVDEVMARSPITVTPETPIYIVAATMLREKVSGLPVVSDGRLVGIITESDIFRVVVETWSGQ